LAAVVTDILNPDEPITKEMIKTHLRIDGNEEDGNIDKYIPLARKAVEIDSSITLVEKEVKMQFEYPEQKYYLKFDTQESGITAMVYTDGSGQVKALSDHKLHKSSLPNYVTAEVPSDATDIKIVYTATPNPGHPVIAAVIEKLISMLTYNVKVKNEALKAYSAIISANQITTFG